MLLHLATALAAANALVAKHPLLPAEEIIPSKHGVAVHLHGGFADFEAWREALNIPPQSLYLRCNRTNAVLRAETVFNGVPVSLVGYSSLLPEEPALRAVAA
ncbi:hypothetical protein [Streptomyces sp. NPDC008150]|uniref:hypothetical protein n=1 Tax=Streptomyces sp. NPDC008150 TaxID=3364816 RepID=UPI0036EF7FFC